jgi:hypothetical protein
MPSFGAREDGAAEGMLAAFCLVPVLVPVLGLVLVPVLGPAPESLAGALTGGLEPEAPDFALPAPETEGLRVSLVATPVAPALIEVLAPELWGAAGWEALVVRCIVKLVFWLLTVLRGGDPC